jgi:hypothetical protein
MYDDIFTQLRQNPARRITRFVTPEGPISIFAKDVGLWEAQELAFAMYHSLAALHLMTSVTGTLEAVQKKVKES